ncbi:MAG: HAD-IIIC family phosphatase [Opitutales bacterium]|nr:HAD-IIIC family phosphatase [Opitutales bacterium]
MRSAHIFRNATLEALSAIFDAGTDCSFSGYGDVSDVPAAREYFWAYTFPFESGSENLAGTLDAYLSGLQLVLKNRVPDAPMTLLAMAAPGCFAVAAQNDFVAAQVARYNAALAKIAETYPACNVKFLPDETLNTIDWRLYFLTKLAFSPRALARVADSAGTPAKPLPVPAVRKKCIVLDLDGTLWAGTLDEDTISCDGDYPANAFRFFQTRLKELAQSGILLAISSKNDMEAVRDIFRRQKMPLALEDFSAVRCDWRDKAEHLKEIASELNLGLDSFVFVDNTAAERGWVKSALPQVAVPDFPDAPYDLPVFYGDLLTRYFRAQKLTAEDLQKTEQYRSNAARERLAGSGIDYESYLRELQIEVSVKINDPATFPRLEQISQKTNQFNLCVSRLRERDFEELLTLGAVIAAVSVSDIFGDSGCVGLAVAVPDGNGVFTIREFALSCRVLGRKIETRMLKLFEEELRSRGAKEIRARFCPTEKNRKYQNFFGDNGIGA